MPAAPILDLLARTARAGVRQKGVHLLSGAGMGFASGDDAPGLMCSVGYRLYTARLRSMKSGTWLEENWPGCLQAFW